MSRLSIFIEKTYPWIKKIPQGSHGHGKYQKKLWKVTSDYVRIRDWYEFKRCISCNKIVEHWSSLQGGHFRAFSICRGYSKFDEVNVFGQCAKCNTAYDSNLIGKEFAKNIVARYGQSRLDLLEKFHIRELEKLEDDKIVYMTWQLLQKMKELPEQPDYFSKLEI